MRLAIILSLASMILGCGSGKKPEDSDEKVTIKSNDSNKHSSTNERAESSSAEKKTTDKIPNTSSGKPIPEDFPKDIPLDRDMTCHSVTKVKDNFMITFHTKKSVSEIVDWFKTKLGENEWQEAGTPSISETKALIAYEKQDRKCGISITGFVMNESMQKDESTRGITIQTKAVK